MHSSSVSDIEDIKDRLRGIVRKFTVTDTHVSLFRMYSYVWKEMCDFVFFVTLDRDSTVPSLYLVHQDSPTHRKS